LNVASEPGLGRRLLLWAITLGIAVLSIEVMLQVYYYASSGGLLFRRVHPPIWSRDPIRCFALKPDMDLEFRTNEFATHIYTNSQGMRSDASRREVSPDKPPGVYRVLFLGPSFTFGWGSEWQDAYPTRIAEALRVPGKRVELINLGTPGQGAANQLCWLAEVGHRFAPDMLVNTVYGERLSPLPDGCPELPCPYIDENGRMYVIEPTLGWRIRDVLKNFGIVFYGYYLVSALAPDSAEGDTQMGREFYSQVERETAASTDELADGYEGYVRYVRRVVGAPIPVAFIHVPLSFVVHLEDRGRWRHLTGADPIFARARIQAEVAEMRSREIPVVDTTPVLVERAPQERLFYWLDAHLTPAGNRVVAEASLPVLEALAASYEARNSPSTTRAQARE